MNLNELIRALADRGVELWHEGDRLRFRAPKGSIDPQERSRLSSNRAEVIALLRAEAAQRESVHPLSFSQSSLWFLHRQAPESTAYHIAMPVRVRSSIDTGALGHAVQGLVDRHAILRTTYREGDGAPQQCVKGDAVAPLALLSVPDIDESELRRTVEADFHRPFDLDAGPVLRVSLYSVSADDHVLLMTVHHIAADGWSLLLLFDELLKLYAEASGGPAANLARPSLAFTDYSRWQEESLKGAEGERLWRYWQGKLAPPRSVLDFPTDHPRPAIKAFRGASVDFGLDAIVTERIKQLARAEGTTLFVVLLAGFNALLHRLCGSEDVIVGTPTFARSKAELLNTVGDFVNSVPLRTGIRATMTFRELLAQVRTTVVEALEAQEFPLPLLVRRLQPDRDPGRFPLFDTFFVFQRFDQFREYEKLLVGSSGDEITETGGLRLASYPLRQQEGQFDLCLRMAEGTGEVRGVFSYDSDLFEESTVRRLARHYGFLVGKLAGDPGTEIGTAPLQSAEDVDWLVHGLNETAVRFQEEAAFTRLFEAQVERKTESTAVRFKGEVLSYHGLNARANQLARRLSSLGVTSGVLAAVCLDRSIDSVVALLAVQKAGGAYLPLDPDFPPERLGFMLADSGASVLITTHGAADGIALPDDVRILDLGLDAAELAAADTANLTVDPRPEDPAYVIYTSGSTGRPKGVVVQHRALSNFLHSMHAQPGLSGNDVLAAVTTLSFDIAGLELYLPLLVGARIELVPRDVSGDGDLLAACLIDSGATVMQATPATWRLLVDAGFRGSPNFRAFCGGEALPRDLAEALLVRAGEVWNLYGPTETTIWSTAGRVESGSGAVSVGRPIANTRIYVVDRLGQVVPVGVAGEIWIGGAGVAIGYHHREDLTAAAFIADPFVQDATDRVYRTGDLGRWRSDGQLEHLGRIDSQVKIRGFRIELGEIETVLSGHSAVRQAVVNPWIAGADDTRLVAYVVLEAGSDLPAADMRQFLRRELPEYMVPAMVVPMAALPLTPNGKIDRGSLPAPQASDEGSDSLPMASQTPTEEALCDIWRDILHVGFVGRGDDFFDLGGHSLLATQVASRIRETFQIELPLRVLFEATTVEALARRIDADAREQRHAPPIPAIETAPGDGPTQLSSSQERMWLTHAMAPDNAAYNIPAAIRLRGPLDAIALGAALESLRRRHETLRSTFGLVDGLPVQNVLPPTGETLAVEDLRACGDGAWAEALRRAQAAGRVPFDLGRGPVLRAALFRTADEEHLLLLCLHHISGDQWSLGIVGRELAIVYNALSSGKPVDLAPLAVQYRDYARWQRRWLEGREMQGQMDYWRQRLAGLPVLTLPTDRPHPTISTYGGAWHVVPLPAELVAKLESFSRQERSTLFMTLYAAFATLLHRLTGQEDIAIGIPVANRLHASVEGLVGVFVNTLVLRADLTGHPSFRSLLQRVRSAALDAYAHQDVPFEKLAEDNARQRHANRAPLVQVLFNVQNPPMHGIAFDRMSWEPVIIDRGGSQFELSLMVDPQVSRSVIMEYDTDLFDHDTIERLVAQYFELLGAVVTAPELSLHAMPLLPAQERQTMESWNATVATYSHASVFSREFEARVAERTASPAVSFDGATLRYGELNARANQLAWRLRELGVGPGDLVAVCLPRGLDLVVALLAVQKSGGAYVPLDPNFPTDRLGYMLSDSAAAVLVTADGAAQGVDVGEGVRVLDLAADAAALDAMSPGDLPTAAGPQDPAYVIYTSGSTGRPKGVVVPHGALLNFLQSMQRVPGLTDRDVLAAVTTISFDIAGLELYLPLLVGGRVELIARDTAVDGDALAVQLAACGATVLQATPATWRLLVEAGWQGGPEFRGLCGGEALSRELADALLVRMGELWNLYGPTETTIWSTAERIQPGRDPITIGRPIANTRVYVLDRVGEAVPIGIAGELWIGGAGVASGYHQRPELTAERFVPDRFAALPGARMYRTGDLCRWRSDGRLEHLGRLDHQVKIRGFRIELGEIESVLAQLSGVRQAVVVAKQVEEGDTRLVAYVVYLPGEDLTTSEVRSFLRQSLPDYMIPSVVMAVDAIPLTPNGKVDRLALPDPFSEVKPDKADAEPPAPGMEQLLAGVWRDVLKVERVAAEDNFFDLGGHSLLSIRVAAAVQRATGWRMDPRTLFFQTLRQVAAGAPASCAAGLGETA